MLNPRSPESDITIPQRITICETPVYPPLAFLHKKDAMPPAAVLLIETIQHYLKCAIDDTAHYQKLFLESLTALPRYLRSVIPVTVHRSSACYCQDSTILGQGVPTPSETSVEHMNLHSRWYARLEALRSRSAPMPSLVSFVSHPLHRLFAQCHVPRLHDTSLVPI